MQTLRYHVIKSSRIYQNRGYKGPASSFKLLEFNYLIDAITAAKEMNKINNVWFTIYDSKDQSIINY